MLCLRVGRNNINHEYNSHNNKLANATEVVNLGVTVDSNMHFDKHINKMMTIDHLRAALISRCFRSKNQMFCLELLWYMCVQF